MNITDVDRCEDSGCHVSPITYAGTEKQISALVELSETCHQDIVVSAIGSVWCAFSGSEVIMSSFSNK
jgi:hypothetical protein